MSHYFEGYTFEEFEKEYGFKPYSYIEGYQVFIEDLVWYSPDRVDIDWAKRRIRQAQEDGEDIEHLFETEDERFAREEREREARKQRARESRIRTEKMLGYRD